MLDPCFKSPQVVESFVGHGNAIRFATKYDVKNVIPFFMTIFYRLNLIIEVIVAPCDEPTLHIEKKDNNMFSVGTSMEESSQALIIIKLFIFQRLFIPPSMCVDLLAWWWTQKG